MARAEKIIVDANVGGGEIEITIHNPDQNRIYESKNFEITSWIGSAMCNTMDTADLEIVARKIRMELRRRPYTEWDMSKEALVWASGYVGNSIAWFVV